MCSGETNFIYLFGASHSNEDMQMANNCQLWVYREFWLLVIIHLYIHHYIYDVRPAGQCTCAIKIMQSTARWTVHAHLHRKLTFTLLDHAHVLLQ
jgi:uncharacterized membrane protein YoaT (DUF817 family)